MKRITKSILLILTVCMMFSMTACLPNNSLVVFDSDECIAITVSSDQMTITSESTLVDYMNSLKDSKELNFEIADGMVTSINGIKNAADYSSCWMLYTSDADNANTAWGTVEYKGNTYGSAIYGAESLKIKDGCLYIWVYKTF